MVYVMIVTILINYIFGIVLGKSQDFGLSYSKLVLTIGICTNILILAFYKYLDFTLVFFNPILVWMGFESMNHQHIPLPLGIYFLLFRLLVT